MISDEMRYEIIRLLEANPEMSQRDVARELGISLGKTNYCLRSLVDVGQIKVRNFKNSQNRTAYLYLLTPRGIEEKANLALRFLQIKIREVESLREEIEDLRKETEGRGPDAARSDVS
jgi:EPS-associated MarR family transcriptional regulator